ncbi:MAG TPA: flagellar FlbD family protein [Candidatus Acidoferrales bacterium]|nr:flagellar FlbD family protein [Candidatus Acidoferrales bacterium]
MIQLTRLNNHPLIINSDLVKLIENAPDTVLTLVTGEKIVVLESSDQVLERIVEFRRRILSGLPLQPIEMAGVGTHASGLACEARVPVKKS